MELNNSQKKAIKHLKGPLLVLAGAGSGKTKVVTQRISNLIENGVDPNAILAVTFTNKAADEMKKRVQDLVNKEVFISTFHSLGARILRESLNYFGYTKNFIIYDDMDSLRLIRDLASSLKIEEKFVKQVKSKISNFKNNLLEEMEPPSKKNEKAFFEIYPLYQQKLQEFNALDFEDLLYLTVKLLKKDENVLIKYQTKWQFILIDEYQDTNHAQNILAKILSEKHKNLFVVGDPDQSIYSWRGAKYQNILNFSKDFENAKIINLEENYRSTNEILFGANSLIEKNSLRLEKKLFSNLGKGEKIKLFIAEDEKKEAFFIIDSIIKQSKKIPLCDIVIFYRTNAQSRLFEDILISKKIPYIVYGGISFYGITTINKLTRLSSVENIPIISLCEKILKDPKNFNISLNKKQKEGLKNYLSIIFSIKKLLLKNYKVSDVILNLLSSSNYLDYLKEDKETFQDREENIGELIAKAKDFDNLEKFLEELTLLTNIEKKEVNSLKLMTLHNGKGLEFFSVFIAGLEEDLFPHINSKKTKEELEEERRLLYVGMTRAKKNLYLTSSLYRFIHGSLKEQRPSRFLGEISNKHMEIISEIGLENLDESKDSSFYIGNLVFHPIFGDGIIKKIYNTSFGQTYDIYFEEDGEIKTLAAKYAKLECR
jgi:DNA helicase-2/ATP-dependent DNA helicase PcrA